MFTEFSQELHCVFLIEVDTAEEVIWYLESQDNILYYSLIGTNFFSCVQKRFGDIYYDSIITYRRNLIKDINDPPYEVGRRVCDDCPDGYECSDDDLCVSGM